MGQTKKRNYDRYTLDYKLQAVRLANHPDVKAIDIAESLGIHPVMLYRWRMEHKKGELRANKHMKPTPPSPKRRPDRTDPAQAARDELKQANKRIKQLEKQLAISRDEVDLLKKAERFFAERRKRDSR
ncbi:MAG: transposase [Pseudomonadales bacterium]